VTTLPDKLFAHIIEATTLDQMVEDGQKEHHALLESWADTHNLQQDAQG